MRLYEGSKPLFDGRYLVQGFESIRKAISDQLRRETKDQILNVNEAQYVEHIFSTYHLDVPEIIESGIQVESSEVEIPAEHHSPSWNVQPGRTYPRQMLTYEVPFTGDYNLFEFAPSHRPFSSPRARIEKHRLLFQFLVLDITANQIREEFQSDLKQIQETLKAMRSDVEGKDEEALRDQFLLMLSPHFQSTSGKFSIEKEKQIYLSAMRRRTSSSRSANSGAERQPNNSPNWQVCFFSSLQNADAVLILGGASSALITFLIAEMRGIAMLPIGTFGGSATSVWGLASKQFDEKVRRITGAPLWKADSAVQLVDALASEHARTVAEKKAKQELAVG